MTSLTRRNAFIGVVLTLAALALIGAIYYQIHSSAADEVTQWAMQHDALAGSSLTADDLTPITVRGTSNPFSQLSQPPTGTNEHLSHNVHAGDLLRPDDIVVGSTVSVSLSVDNSPPLSAGDTVDLYAQVDGKTQLVGKRLIVLSPSRPIVVLIPANEEALWAAISQGGVKLTGVRIDGTGQPVTTSSDAASALAALARSVAATPTPGAGGSPAPGASPAPGGAASPAPGASPSPSAAPPSAKP